MKKGKKCLGDVVEDPEDREDATVPEAPAIITVAEAAEAEAAAEDNPFFTVDDDEESAMAMPPVPSPAAAPAAEAAEIDRVAGAATPRTSAVAAEHATTPPPRVSRVAQAALSYADRSRDLSDLSLKWMAHYHFDQGNQVP